jgi:hypothetical protein
MLEFAQEFHRVPRVRHLEYLLAFLDCVNNGKYDSRSLLNSMIEERTKFEQEKLRALGKGRTFDKQDLLKRGKGRDLAHSVQQLANQLELAKQTTNGKLVLSEQGSVLLKSGLGNEDTRYRLVVSMLERYPAFRQVLLAIRNNDGKVSLPTARGKELFENEARKYGIICDQWDYEIVRDIATQLELVNWMKDLKSVERKHTVYLICEVVTWSDITHARAVTKGKSFKDMCIQHFKANLRSHLSSPKEEILAAATSRGYIVTRRVRNPLLLKPLATNEDGFDEALWSEYLKLTKQSPMRPIFFSALRERVCERLLMSNMAFDIQVIRMINMPSTYRTKVYPGGGALPHLPGIDMLRKDLPPKTGTDEYITYLKLDRSE